MGNATHIRIGGARIALQAGETIADPCEGLEFLARTNLRALQRDPVLRAEALRRVLSPPCAARCYVQRDGGGNLTHDCTCSSGFQYGSDDHAQDLEGCPARDVWSDLRSLIAGHNGRADLRGQDPAAHPIVADCDDVTPAGLAVCAWIAWFAPRGYGLGGIEDLGSHRNDAARFAVGITLPADKPGGATSGEDRMAHAYGLTTLAPPDPQPDIRMGKSGLWRVWDPAAHWGMKRPPAGYYDATKTGGQVAIFELRREHLDGLSLSDM